MKSKVLEYKSSWPIIGNEHIVSFLEKSIANREVGGTYIFLGPANLGKTTVAKFLAASLLCANSQQGVFSPPCGGCSSCLQMKTSVPESGSQREIAEPAHFDYQVIKKLPNKKNVSIVQAREFINNLSLSSLTNSYKIGVVKDAETLSLGASNALLKTLEEPRKNTIIILIASNLEDIPDTIASRSQVLHFYPVKSDLIYDHLVNDLGASRSMAKNISRLSLGRPALALKFFRDKEFLQDYTDKAELFLDLARLDITGRLNKIGELFSAKYFVSEKVDNEKNTADSLESSTSEDEEPDRGIAQAKVKHSLMILGIWQAVARDIMLALSSNENLIQHEIFNAKIDLIKTSFNQNSLLKLNKFFDLSRERIGANVNPKLVLENFVCNI